MPGEILNALGLAVPFDIVAAGVHRPDRLGDLSPDQFIIGVTGAKGDVDFALRQVEMAAAHHELDPERGMLRVKSVDQAGLRQPSNDRLRAGDADHTLHILLDVAGPPREIDDRSLNAFGIRQHRLAEFGQAVTALLTHHQRAAEPPFEFMSRRCTVDWLRPSALPAAMVLPWRATARKYFEVVPVEHERIMHFCGRHPQCCGSLP